MNKHRSKRGSIASRISCINKDQLPLINTQATSVEITNWKKSDKVRACYNKLPSYIERILQRACGSEKQRSPAQVVFAKTLVKAMLNPKINQLRINEDFMKNKIEKYSVQNSNYFFF